MAKRQNTFEKRRRDMEKKLRAEEKRKKRQQKKDRSATLTEPAAASPGSEVEPAAESGD